ncbi:hypothetical protein QCA50_001087 [Cerrena zonata]|uniref:Uncharacterized protein n=1 Tax=Cerrena zonata TaxID=2478898 RepID=A0AAW0H0F7_9APHY
MSDTPKQHTLKISNGASSSGRNVIDINSLKVANAVDTVQIPGPTSSSSPPKSHTVAIAVGVSVGAVVLIAVLIFLWRWFNSRRGHQKQEYDLVRPRPYGPNGPSGSPMTSVVFNSIHSTADRLSQQFRTPTKRISMGSTENLMLDIRQGQDVEMSVPTNRTMESGDVEPPTSPQATLAPDDYEGGSILVPQQTLDSRSSRYLSRTPTLILGGRKPSRSTTLETLCGDDPDGVPLLDPSLPPRLPSLAFSPSPTMIAFPRMSRIPSGRLSRPGSRISPSGPREPRNRSIRIPSIHTTNPPASFLHMSRSSQSTAGQTTTTSSS